MDLKDPTRCDRGIWIPLEQGRRMIEMDDQCRACKVDLEYHQQASILRQRNVDLLKRQIDGMMVDATEQSRKLREADNRASNLEALLDAQEGWRNPWIWLAVGMVVGGGGVAAVALR